jgi:hypothetical protein
MCHEVFQQQREQHFNAAADHAYRTLIFEETQIVAFRLKKF